MRRRFVVSRLVLAVLLTACIATPAALTSVELPARLTDEEFWKLSRELSEPDGSFRSDNLISNELGFPSLIPGLVSATRPGGVYLGVGPEQNFHYISALKPKIAFIIDVRRGNWHLQMMYKALFEMSSDRADFMSRLFTKPRPAGLDAKASIEAIVNAYWDAHSSGEAVYKANLQAIVTHLEKKHGFPLSAEDRQGIEYVYYNFYWFGPVIHYGSSTGGTGRVNYADLMLGTDFNGVRRSFLATEESFAVMKDLESRNLLVPVVGNFAGPKALRSVGQYLKDRGGVVTAFYLSNVEQYLTQDGIWGAFCANVAALPLDAASTFIRSRGGMQLAGIAAEVKTCGFAQVHWRGAR